MGEQHSVYCLKCRTRVQAKNHEHASLKNGRPAVRGTCPACGTKVFRIGQG
ncbi:DUF5679 domain-containing protein [Chloroflexota bacterium]